MDSAKVSISVIPENLTGTALKKLKQNSKLFSGLLKKKLNIKYIPRFTWIIDDTERGAAVIEETLEKIVAIGDVKIDQDMGMQGFCQKATYLNQEEILILEEDVEYRDEMGNTLQAQKVTIWTREERLEAEGNPVKSTYILKEEESGTTGGESQ